MKDLIDRQAAIDKLKGISFSYWFEFGEYLSEDTREIKIINSNKALEVINALPSAQPQYEPVTAEDFAKIMSENTLYNFMAWHGVALELMERQGLVICKKTI